MSDPAELSEILSRDISPGALYVTGKRFYEAIEDLCVPPCVSHVLSVGVCLSERAKSKLCDAGITVIEVLEVEDIPEESLLNSSYFALLDQVSQSAAGIILNCVQGQSRSVSGAIYLLILKGYSVENACSLVKERRAGIAVNPGFLAQLFLIDTLRNTHKQKRSIHCKKCSKQVDCSSSNERREIDGPSASIDTNNAMNRSWDKHAIDSELLGQSYYDRVHQFISDYGDSFWLKYVPRLVSRARKARDQRKKEKKRKREREEETDDASAMKLILTPISESSDAYDYYYVPLQPCPASSRLEDPPPAPVSSIICDNCSTCLGLKGVTLGLAGNYVVVNAIAIDKNNVYCEEVV